MTHSKVSVYSLVGAVRTHMAHITSAVALANETAQEGIADDKTILINWSELEGAAKSQTHQNTFGKGLQLRRIVVEITLFARARNDLGEGLADVAKYSDDIMNELESQSAGTPFGLSGVHTFHWSAKQGIINYGGIDYAGAIFTLEFLCH
jgi:hypothetical protein